MNHLPVLVLVLVVFACDPASHENLQARPTERSHLAQGLLSYSNASSVERQLGVGADAWRVIEDTKYEGSAWRPAYQMRIAFVPGQQMDGVEGELEVRFFNDRLMETSFCSVEFEKLIKVVARTYPGITSGAEVAGPKHTRIRIGPSGSGKRCVVWSDARLTDELRRWIQAYS